MFDQPDAHLTIDHKKSDERILRDREEGRRGYSYLFLSTDKGEEETEKNSPEESKAEELL